jgi:cysteine desulfurase
VTGEKKMNKQVYLDHAATTYTRKEVIDAMMPYYSTIFGNPSSVHAFGREARRALNEYRTKVATIFNVKESELFFTSGGTESDNWAIKGVAAANAKKGKHIITTKIEHHAVLHTCEYLEKEGYEVTYLSVDEYGVVDLDELKGALREDTVLVSIMYANNEIGTIQPIDKIGTIIRENSSAVFHTDAVQAVGAVKIDLQKLETVDILSFSSHKFYGPKGIGGLFVRKGTRISNLQHGGAQESRRRAGTENLPGIIGLAKALELANNEMNQESQRLIELRDYLIETILSEIPYTRLNGHRTQRLPNNVSFCFNFIEGEALLLSLDAKGIAGSSGSACTSGSLDPSHVLLAIGLPHEIAHGSLRLTLGKSTTKEEIDYTIKSIKVVVDQLRAMSPLYEPEKGGDVNV